MSWEIERRYLVRLGPGVALPEPGTTLRQGYLLSGPWSVRIRTGEPRGAVLTCKQGTGVKRREIETVVPAEMADALFEAAEDRILTKVRYVIDGWELDRFEGPLAGLFVLEIELEHEEEPVPEPPQGVEILREVTMDKSFMSSGLASMVPEDQRALVTHLYAEMSA